MTREPATRKPENPASPWAASPWREAVFLAVLFLFSIFLRSEYIRNTEMIQPVRADARLYALIAHNLVVNHTFTTDTEPPLAFHLSGREPGYPIFLAGLMFLTNPEGRDFEAFYNAVLSWQCALSALTVIMAYLLARFFLPPLWSGVVGVLTLLSPHLMTLTGYVLTETLFTFLLQTALLLLFLAIRRNRLWLFAAGGTALGLAIMVRGTIWPLAPVLAAATFIFLRRRETGGKFALRAAGTLLAGSLVFYAAWGIYKGAHEQVGEKSSDLLISMLYEGSYPGVYFRTPEMIGMVHREDPGFGRVTAGGMPAVLSAIGEKFRVEPWRESFWYLAGKPAMFWRWDLFHFPDIDEYPVRVSWYQTNGLMGATKGVMKAIHPFLVLLMAAGTVFYFYFRRWRKMEREQVFLLGTVLALVAWFTLVHSIMVPSPRYALPLRPQLYFLAVLTVRTIWGLFAEKRKRVR